MKQPLQKNRRINIFSFVLTFVMSINFSFHAQAQVTTMNDYAVFGGDQNCPTGPGQTPPGGSALGTGCRVHIGAGSVVNGNVGSYHFVEANGGVTINGNVYSGGRVNFANVVQANRVTAANGDNESVDIFSTGNTATILGNIDVLGDISIVVSGSSVAGTVTHPPGTTYSGPAPASEVVAAPPLPTLPVMPAITPLTCPTGSSDNITGTRVITPGTYSNITLGNGAGQSVTFSGPGNYYFNSIKMGQGPTHTFIYDFLGLGGNINIYVCGDVNMGDIETTFANPSTEDACRIYFETHGTGATNGSDGTYSFLIGAGSNFFGTVWAPFAAIQIGGSSCCTYATGHLWSATQVDIQHGVTITECTPCSGSITICKNVACGDISSIAQWNFTSDIPGHASFSLPASGGCVVFDNIPNGSYTVTEVPVAGWQTSNSCHPNAANSSDSAQALITVSNCSSESCTFSNKRINSITICRESVCGDISSIVGGNFTSDIPGHASFSIPADGGCITFYNVPDGNYTITEANIPGWKIWNSCHPNAANLDDSVKILLAITNCNDANCTFSNQEINTLTIRKFVRRPDANCSLALILDWNFEGDLGNFTIHAGTDSVLFGNVVGYFGEKTFNNIPPGTYTVNEALIPVPLSGPYWQFETPSSTFVIPECGKSVTSFSNVPTRCQPEGCQWCNKGAVLSQVWQNPGKLTHDACVVPDILVDVTMAHGGANDVVDATEIGTGEPATWSIQAAINYINTLGSDPSPSTPGETFIGVTSTQPTPVDPLDSNSCGYSCSRTLGGDNPHGVENVIVTNTLSARMNIFGCSVTMWPANANLPVFTIQNSVGKVTILDLHVKYDNVAGYLIKSGNADLVVVKNSAAWYNDIGYNVQDDNVEITGAQHINGNRIGILVSGSNVKLRTNSDVILNTEAGIKITGNNNETNGNEVGVSGKPNALGILVTGNSNNIHGDAVNYNTGNGVVIAGNLNTINDVDANKNGGAGFLISGNSNTISGCKQVKENGGDGFKVTGLNNLLDGNVAESNGGNGFKADIADGASGNKFDDNEAKSNSLQGIRACGQIDLGNNEASGNGVSPQMAFSCGLPANAKFSVVDIGTDKSYKYDGSFNLISVTSLTGNNADANDASDNGTGTYVLDKSDKQVYRYVGGNATSRPLKTNGGGSLNNPSGLAIDGDQMWVLDGGNKYIYRYSLSAAFTGNTNYTALQGIALAANNSKGEGLAIDATYLYVVDNNTKQFYRYPRAGGAGVVSKVFKDNAAGSLSNAMGAVLDGTTMWIVDNNKRKAYSYTLASLAFGVAGNINAGSAFSLYSENTNPTGIALGNSSNLLRTQETPMMSNALLQVYPNPTSGNITVQFTSTTTDQYSVNVSDVSGRIVKSFNKTAVEGINTLDVNLEDVAAGVYFLVIQSPDMNEVKRIMVQR